MSGSARFDIGHAQKEEVFAERPGSTGRNRAGDQGAGGVLRRRINQRVWRKRGRRAPQPATAWPIDPCLNVCISICRSLHCVLYALENAPCRSLSARPLKPGIYSQMAHHWSQRLREPLDVSGKGPVLWPVAKSFASGFLQPVYSSGQDFDRSILVQRNTPQRPPTTRGSSESCFSPGLLPL
jgi:hypothetical protein